ncbi:MAG: AraC family transcriptional regulator [Thermoleophilaceae bacterium]|nr:AraC family transcriptional regulator [Thermoleophilaceae bacterium]
MTAELEIELRHREPLDADALLGFLALRAVPGVEEVTAGGAYRRTLRLTHGPGSAELCPLGAGRVACRLRLADERDRGQALTICRRLFDLDMDPVAVAEGLGGDPLVAPLVARRPGLRVPGAADPAELAVRAVLGQQVSVSGARTVAGRLVERYGESLPAPDGELTHVFPSAAALAAADPQDLPMPRRRAGALIGLCAALCDGGLSLDPGGDLEGTRAALLDLPGIGPWTAGYVAMRALGDADAWPPGDLGLRHAVERLGAAGDGDALTRRAERWRPWRAYATLHLWTSLGDGVPGARAA